VRLSTKTRYGARAMAELAVAYPGRSLTLREIAERQHLSTKYLEQIMRALGSAGLTRSVRGVHGGYTLAKSPECITLADVFHALEGSLAPVDCVDAPELCAMREACPTRSVWVEVKEAVESVLEGTTLQDLAERMGKNAAQEAPSYQI